ncbi:phosphatidylinositol 5-phosphate 4-kinase type-2 beta [Octopus bimaculoides]|uniref:phosphatidylinositol 5-phosphate 4-kinase type-2 beta n=1 Tax=Octopus bimaculoides TaxID=37653 RepID=UPI00071E4BF7|nr:phosphatidylinositol 5-phosphate 4-kinase type-2 beta [Octopus bimaculoides]|eukprot:XP_014773204.1 PREDICTED: phosphatidylinositol 5-phosphate 4-kinase type-2 beta-like [Octopus bimaculoides]
MASAKRKHLKMKTVQQKVKLFRANEPLLSVFMWGINHTINELSHIPVPVMLMPDDFKAFTKVRKDNHLYNKENMPSHFKVKEYCPMVFRNLRERFSVDDIDYMNSLTKQPVEMDSPGRSGARMLLSQDKKYFIKTLVSEEVEQMHHILKQYHSYIVEIHAQTLLPQYLGMYRITVNDVETYLVVLRNVFSPRLTIHKKYDLKGSTVDRQASDKEKAKDLPTLKDNDFVNDGVIIHIGADTVLKIITSLKSCSFLASLHLMDYSLIVGIHDCEKAEQEAFEAQLEAEAEAENGENADGEADDGLLEEEEINDVMGSVPTPPDSPQTFVGQPFTGEVDPKIEIFGIKSEKEDKQIIYFLAMIDILTKYGMKKRTAQAAKTVKHGSGAEISTVRPDQYAKRFLEFIERSIE